VRAMYVEQPSDTSGLPPHSWQYSLVVPTEPASDPPVIAYVEELAAKGIVSGDAREAAIRLWDAIRNRAGRVLAVPDVAAGGDGRLMLAFDDGVRHLEFEIVGKGQVEVFAFRRDSGETWETELDCNLFLDEALLHRIGWFAQ